MEEEKQVNLVQSDSSQYLIDLVKDANYMILGEGTYGVVLKMYDIKKKEYVAVKKIKLENQEDEGIPSSSIREISILKCLHHPHIIELYDIKYNPSKKRLYYIFEYAEYDLRKYISQKWPLSLYFVKETLQGILQGLTYCHAKQILHRDIKPQNILVNILGKAKIADFGLARTFHFPMARYTREIATLWYRAPELLLGDDQYGTAVDIWAVGCIMGEMLTSKPIFVGESQIEMLFKIMNVLGTPSGNSYIGITKLAEYKLSFPKFKPIDIEEYIPQLSNDKEGQDLLSKMLAFNPADRQEAKQLLQHKWFSDIIKQ